MYIGASVTGADSSEGVSCSVVALEIKAAPAVPRFLEGPTSALAFFLDWPAGAI